MAVTVRPSGLNVSIVLNATDLNTVFNNIFEVLLMEIGTYKLAADGVTAIDEDSTIQDYVGNQLLSDKEAWDYCINTLGKSVRTLTRDNLFAITPELVNQSTQNARFYSLNVAEISANSNIAEFIILAVQNRIIKRSTTYTDAVPSYSEGADAGTVMTGVISKGTYFIACRTTALEDSATSSVIKVKREALFYNDWYPTDFGSALKGHAFVRNVSGTLYFRDNNGNNAVGGSIVIEEGRKLWVGGANVSTMLGDAANYVGNEIMFVRAGKSHGNPSLRYGYGYSYSGGLDFHAHKITIANGANLIALDQTASYWTVSGDGYYISIIIINTAKTGTAVAGGIKWTKVSPDVNSIVTAGVKAYTNKNGALQLQTIGAGLTATADAAANSGMDGNGAFKNLGGTERLGVAMIAYKSSFTNQDIQNVFDYCKKQLKVY